MKPIHALAAAFALAAGFALGACSGSTEDDHDHDAGHTDMTDAGHTDMTDAGHTDMTDAGSHEHDAGTTNECTGSCSHDGSNDCACFLNADCAATFRCESTEGELYGTCKCGARGTKTYDAACTDSNECDTGICGDGYCTKECTSDADCSGTHATKCNSVYGICILPPT